MSMSFRTQTEAPSAHGPSQWTTPVVAMLGTLAAGVGYATVALLHTPPSTSLYTTNPTTIVGQTVTSVVPRLGFPPVSATRANATTRAATYVPQSEAIHFTPSEGSFADAKVWHGLPLVVMSSGCTSIPLNLFVHPFSSLPKVVEAPDVTDDV